MPSLSPGDDPIARVLKHAAPGSTLAEHEAYNRLCGDLFGRPSRPLTLSRYVLLAQRGAGGSGVVFEAYDPELDRKVAIKLMRAERAADVDASRAGARLLREAQTLAKVSHPNVIAVYDVGSYGVDAFEHVANAGAGVYMVMELVAGESLRAWMARGPHPWRAALEVFLAAGEGLRAAHACGLVHRDFKPENVLIGRDGRVRVLDFGLARPSGESPRGSVAGLVAALVAGLAPVRAGERLPSLQAIPPRSVNESGALLGTPAYMAPEQRCGASVDARSDQYSFCLTLYEAVYGRVPAFDDAGETRAFEGRRVPRRIQQAIARGLSVRPEARYPAMDELLRALEGEPWRRIGPLGWLAGLATAVTLGWVGAAAWLPGPAAACDAEERLSGVWDAPMRARVEQALLMGDQPFARETWTGVAQILDAYTERWKALRTQACGAGEGGGTVRERHELMLCLDRRVRSLGEVTELLAVADETLTEHAVTAVSALPPLEACELKLTGDRSPQLEAVRTAEEREGLVAVEGRIARAETLFLAARYDEAARAASEAVVRARRVSDKLGEARAQLIAGRIERALGKRPASEALLFEAFLAAEAAKDGNLLAHAALELAQAAQDVPGRDQEVTRWLRVAETHIRSEHLHREHAATLELERGRIAMRVQDYDEAASHFERAVELGRAVTGPREGRVGTVRAVRDELALASAHFSLGTAYHKLARRQEALREYEQALERKQRHLGPLHPEIATILNNKGALLGSLGRHEEQLEHHREVLEIRTATLPDGHRDLLGSRHNIASTLYMLRRYEEAVRAFEDAIAFGEASDLIEPRDLIGTRTNLAHTFTALGRYAEAIAHGEPVLALVEQLYGRDDPKMIDPLAVLALAYSHTPQTKRAVEYAERATLLTEKTVGDEHPEFAEKALNLGLAYLADGQPDRAAPWIERTLRIAHTVESDPRAVPETKYALARAIVHRDRERAVSLAREAHEGVTSLGLVDDMREIAKWLSKHRS